MVGKRFDGDRKITEASSPDAKKWLGWGTALKPASEHWILVRKPLAEHNTAANVLKFGTGGLNIDASRIPTDDQIPTTHNLDLSGSAYLQPGGARSETSVYQQHPAGRFPTNLLLTRSDAEDCPVAALDAMLLNDLKPSRYFKSFEPDPFLYCAKPAAKEKGRDNNHPTVKPLGLMRYLCRMITPPGGVVFDPFTGSGTTGVAALQESFRVFRYRAGAELPRDCLGPNV